MPVIITLDRERELRLDFNALAKFEIVTGRSALAESTWSTVRALDISAIIWAGHLAHAEAEYLLAGLPVPDDLDCLSLGQVRAILTPERVDEVQAILADLWGMFFPESPKEGGSGEDPLEG